MRALKNNILPPAANHAPGACGWRRLAGPLAAGVLLVSGATALGGIVPTRLSPVTPSTPAQPSVVVTVDFPASAGPTEPAWPAPVSDAPPATPAGLSADILPTPVEAPAAPAPAASEAGSVQGSPRQPEPILLPLPTAARTGMAGLIGLAVLTLLRRGRRWII